MSTNLAHNSFVLKQLQAFFTKFIFPLLGKRWLRVVIMGYLIIFIIISFCQSLIIFPGRIKQGWQSTQVVAPPDSELIKLKTAQGEDIFALYGSALTPQENKVTTPANAPTIIYFYGNASCLSNSLPEFQDFRRLGFNVLIPEYVGYGMSSGKSSEAACYATADAAYQYLITHKAVDTHKVIIAGWSLGSAVAIDLAARKPVAGLAIFSPFTSMQDMAKRLFPIFPTNLILQSQFNNRAKISHIHCPILMIHGRSDYRVPFAMSEQLQMSAKSHVTKLNIDNAGHNKIFLYLESLKTLQDFIHNLS